MHKKVSVKPNISMIEEPDPASMNSSDMDDIDNRGGSELSI